MCGRFDTSHLTWSDIHRQLSTLFPVTSAAPNMEPNDDVLPTTGQLVARVEGGGWTVEKMRWSLLPHYWNGKSIKDSEKGKGDDLELNTFSCKTEPFTEPDGRISATCAGPFKSKRCIVPASAWYEWTGDKGSKTKHRFARADGKPSREETGRRRTPKPKRVRAVRRQGSRAAQFAAPCPRAVP